MENKELKKLLDTVVFDLMNIFAEKQVIKYKNHNIIITQVDEEENMSYGVPTCETLLKMLIDNELYLVTVATRLYCKANSEWRAY